MKKETLHNMISLIDDEFIEEADPSVTRKSTKKRISFNISKINFNRIVAYAACLILMLNLAICIPFLLNRDTLPPEDGSGIVAGGEVAGEENGDTSEKEKPLVIIDAPQAIIPSRYNDELAEIETSELDEVLSESTPGADSVWRELLQYIALDQEEKENALDKSEEQLNDAMDEASGTGSYVEVTDLQVDGVGEGDIIKASGSHIFYIKNDTLIVYSIDKGEIAEAGLFSYKYIIEAVDEEIARLDEEMLEEVLDIKEATQELYLSQDGKKATIVARTSRDSYIETTTVIMLNCESVADIKLEKTVTLFGELVESRMVNGELLLFTSYEAKKGYEIPQLFADEEFDFVSSDDIYMPKNPSSQKYLITLRLDAETLESKGFKAFYSYSDIFYVTKDTIYLTRPYIAGINGVDERISTEILRLSLEDSLEVKGKTSVDGFLKNRYSMGESDGLLTVVTTTSARENGIIQPSSASLYCIGAADMTVLSDVSNFAPSGEEVKSVRHDKNKVYVCTAVKLTDPVFAFDITDYNSITYTQTEEIQGFSTSLISFGDYLVGIGTSGSGLKIEVYKEENGAVVAVSQYTQSASYANDYKAYFINRGNGLIGLGVNNSKYIVLKLQEDGTLQELINTGFAGNDYLKRAVLIDNYLYVISTNQYSVYYLQ